MRRSLIVLGNITADILVGSLIGVIAYGFWRDGAVAITVGSAAYGASVVLDFKFFKVRDDTTLKDWDVIHNDSEEE